MAGVFAILDESQSGKSTTIRALTGAFQRGLLQVATQDGNIDVFVQIKALQEANISPEEFVQTINTTENGPDVLVALRLRALRANPDAFGYIETFEREGWDVVAIVLLGQAPQESSI